MLSKKRVKIIIKLLILIFALIFLVKVFTLTYAKYESIGTTIPDVGIAFFITKTDFKSMTLNLDKIYPQNNPYVYKFSISNTDGTNRAETDLEYDLQIRTTTNLPLTYELYKNEEYNSSGANNIIQTNTVEQDAGGTYFRTITTNTENFDYKNDQTNIYELVVYLPAQYNTENYQDIIEMIEININSKQVI